MVYIGYFAKDICAITITLILRGPCSAKHSCQFKNRRAVCVDVG